MTDERQMTPGQLPWQTFQDADSIDVMDANGFHIAKMESLAEDGEAQAELIALAVNQYAALSRNNATLVAALKEALSQLETNYMQAVSKGHHWPNERVNMTSAAKLKGRNALAEAKV